ncbi:hypothetical protein ACFVX6_12840 [Streptomyces sp. NPDC058289]|uniref:hypothetical protein n=1 Tax=Streptomyces sp. NPDC058289 TaxID=3346425 RepID=UPI0036E4D862
MLLPVDGDGAGAERYLRVLADTGDPAPYGAFEIQQRSDGLVPAARGRGRTAGLL